MTVPNVTLDDMVAELGISRWDALIVGDGSATTWEHGCGWAAVMVDAATRREERFCGCCSRGTNHTGELRAYLEPMLWYTQNLGREHLKSRLALYGEEPCLVVHIVTDSEVVAKQGNGEMARKANRALWAAMDSFVADGYAIAWHWAGRSRLAENRWADDRAGRMRKAMEGLESVAEWATTNE